MLTFLLNNWTTSLPLLVVIIALIILELKHRGSGKHQLASQEAVFFLNQKKSLIIDLRPEAAFKESHIAKAKNFSEKTLKQDLTPIKKYYNDPILVICDTGMHAMRFAGWLRGQKFVEVKTVRGGLQQWRKDKLPLVN